MKIATLVLITLVSAMSWGQTPPAPPSQTVYKKSESHKFLGLKLKGQLKKPELSYIYKRKGLRAEKIINIPENFNERILEGGRQF